MAENSDNSWVIAGSEGLPVETVGPELGAATQTPADEEPAGDAHPKGDGIWDEHTASPGRQSEVPRLSTSPSPEEAEFEDSAEYPRGTPSPAASPGPGTQGSEALETQAQEGLGSDDPELGSGTSTQGSAPTGKAEESPEEVSSSEDDTQGLRRRQMRDLPPAPSGPAERRAAEAAGGEESGLSVNPCLLAVLALLGVGLLAFSGAIYSPGDGSVESVGPRDVPEGEQQQPLVAGVKDGQQLPPPDPAGDPQSLHSMSLLLDKLAKENQDIRLLQAELQAQKDELQDLLQKSEGEKASAGSQQQSLAGENARLRQALQQEGDAHRSAQAELRLLREQLQGLEGEAVSGRPLAAGQPHDQRLAAEARRLHQELDTQRGLLASMQQELEGALQRAQGSGQPEQLREELAGMEQRLAQALQRAASWEQSSSAGGGEEGEGAPEPSRPPRQEAPKAAQKEGGWHKRQEAGEERRRWHGAPAGRERREQAGAKHPKRREEPELQKRQGPWDPRPAKQRRAGGEKGALRGHHEHNVFWEPPRLHRYRAPQGCTGVADCARQEGLELFGAELAPVQKGPFLQLLQGYMAGRGWGQHYTGLAALLDGAFAPDGAFAHDRLRFRHFVGAVEELLEALAEQELGDEEAADDFEEHVLQHYGGDGFLKKERERRGAKQRRTAHAHRGKETSPPGKG